MFFNQINQKGHLCNKQGHQGHSGFMGLPFHCAPTGTFRCGVAVVSCGTTELTSKKTQFPPSKFHPARPLSLWPWKVCNSLTMKLWSNFIMMSFSLHPTPAKQLWSRTAQREVDQATSNTSKLSYKAFGLPSPGTRMPWDPRTCGWVTRWASSKERPGSHLRSFGGAPGVGAGLTSLLHDLLLQALLHHIALGQGLDHIWIACGFRVWEGSSLAPKKTCGG